MIDDALDYGGNSKDLGKDVGDDFREGKITLPVVLAYRRGTDEEREFWRGAMEEGKIEDGDLDKAIDLLNRYAAISDTLDRARHYGTVARDALAPFPDSPHKTALLQALDFCISRAH